MVITVTIARHSKNIFSQFPLRIIKRYNYNSQERWRRTKMLNEALPVSRSDPVIMKLDTPEFHSILTPEVNALTDLFKKYNYEIRVAGGAVRDILMGKTPTDLDFATTATPQEMKEMFTKENIRMVNSNGEKHGTITPRINDKENFEVTTLRVDVVTDGRHAEVLFTKDWKLDANRRDLTINSMFLGFDGSVYDYFYGYDDLQKRKIAFVGNAATRIQEDYLRILRYFRFYGRIADSAENHDEGTINAIKENTDGLERISGERIWNEWAKILAGKFYRELTIKMLECGLTKYIGLPASPNLENFLTVSKRAEAENIILKPPTLLAALLKNEEEVMDLHSRLKFSAFERDLALYIVQHKDDIFTDKSLKTFQLFLLVNKGKINDKREFVLELFRYKGQFHLIENFKNWKLPLFPVNGTMIQPYVSRPKLIGKVIAILQEIWVENEFKLNQQELMKYVPEIVAEFKDVRIANK
ncbi:CCA tRNA nucleotidyltransferase 1, mitochondrial isoform X1 [Leptopilina heterotoma]|uniref:CCA tRNA nucleotidyltransferase 1, mitochondrial isoform X1 n=1 Tax=Leptopilina heterotoma TaxID=63436 RepID=UPI001CA95F38|nr:CCA tRNA nucleotidyltransferase 1, mitochondrial isoform X1 [Leptopilina heterotoma]